MNETIAIIGGGNMAAALIGGLIQSGVKAQAIHVIDHHAEKLKNLQKCYSVSTHDCLGDWLCEAKAVVLAVKPQVLAKACREVRTFLDKETLIISIAAGVRLAQLQEWMQSSYIVRAMPNTPSMVGAGVVGVIIPQTLSESHSGLARKLVEAMGKVIEVKSESELDWLSTVPGSGPAYVFKMMEALEAAMLHRGFDSEKAREMAVMTVVGAAELALKTQDSPATLREKVTSKGGTTAQALRVMDEYGFMKMMDDAVQAAYNRNQELAEELKAS